jgi:hypothetical protein
VIPFKDLQVLSSVWNRGVLGKLWEGIDRRRPLREMPDEGSGLSNTRLAASSHVEPLQILKDMAACLTMSVSFMAKGEHGLKRRDQP